MAEKDLPSSSDESDEDFVPDNETNELLSEESGSGDEEEAEADGDQKKGRRNRKRRKVKSEENKEEEPVAKKKEVDIDSLWADFKQDVNQKKPDSDKVELKPETEKLPEKKPVKNLPSFSKKPVAKGGLASVLNKLGKKDKLSTLEKSKLDWNKFKQSEGIDDEIKIHNRGKDGYLEKQDFLQRADQRQFEIEKQLRTTTRSFR